MERTNAIAFMLSALVLFGCDPTPESEAAPAHEALPPKTGAAPEHVKIIGYQLAPGATDEEVNRLLAEGLSEADIAARGLVTNVRTITTKPAWSGESSGVFADYEEGIADGQTLSLILMQTERVNVYHTPSPSSCRMIEVNATTWWLPRDWSPQVRSEWFWRVGAGVWNQWAVYELPQFPIPVPVWSGSDGPSFRYQLINHAINFDIPGVTEPGRRDVTLRAIAQPPRVCGHGGGGGGGSW